MKAAPAPRPSTATRLLVLEPDTRRMSDDGIDALPSLLRPGDLIVVNDAATFPASLAAWTAQGEPIEVRLAAPPEGRRARAVLFGEGDWRTPTEHRPAPPTLALGARIAVAGTTATIEARSPLSPRLVTLAFEADAWSSIYRYGRPVQYSYLDADLPLATFQTSYASRPWAAEMPSAGRPLSLGTLTALRRRGVAVATVTHAAGLSATGDEALDRALPLAERYDIPAATVAALTAARAVGGRVIAVGTTVVRALEGAAERDGEGARQVVRGGLRRAVGAPARIGLDGCVRADEGDDAALAHEHRADDGARQPERADDVDRERALEVLGGGVDERRQRDRSERAGGVNEHVDGSEARRRLTCDARRRAGRCGRDGEADGTAGCAMTCEPPRSSARCAGCALGERRTPRSAEASVARVVSRLNTRVDGRQCGPDRPLPLRLISYSRRNATAFGRMPSITRPRRAIGLLPTDWRARQ